MIKEPLRKNKTNPACLVARSSESGKVIGVRLGEVVDRDTFQQGTIHQGRWFYPKLFNIQSILPSLVKRKKIVERRKRFCLLRQCSFDEWSKFAIDGMRFERIEKWPTFVPVSRRLRKWSNWTNLETKFNFGHHYIFNIPETSGSQRLYLDNLVCVTPEVKYTF